MKVYIKLLIEEQCDKSTASIYLSIAIAYLHSLNWDEAAYVLKCIKDLSLLAEEKKAWIYLRTIIENKDEGKLKDLLAYLNE